MTLSLTTYNVKGKTPMYLDPMQGLDALQAINCPQGPPQRSCWVRPGGTNTLTKRLKVKKKRPPTTPAMASSTNTKILKMKETTLTIKPTQTMQGYVQACPSLQAGCRRSPLWWPDVHQPQYPTRAWQWYHQSSLPSAMPSRSLVGATLVTRSLSWPWPVSSSLRFGMAHVAHQKGSWGLDQNALWWH